MLGNLPKPTIFAHRGASSHAPENTITAFDLAMEHGADALELDVQLTADDHVVVMHDKSVKRTTNSEGNISSMQLKDISILDAGSSFDQKFQGEPVPTLEEVFDRYKGKIFINIELKNETSPWNNLPDRVVQIVNLFNIAEEVLISSFNPFAILRTRRLDPNIPIAALAYQGWKGEPVRRMSGNPLKTQALHVELRDVNKQLVVQAHKKNQRLHVYTVNCVVDIQRMKTMDVDGLFTDNPLLAHRILRKEFNKT